mmetsp:Transcript_52323/g.124898  ORF Transcript_52323/g.124898 Transcript_52323/m.124898 type:complete len:314 (+) Transcript_52323:198-1139(+)
MTYSRHLPLHFEVNVVQVPLQVLALELLLQVFIPLDLRLHAFQLHVHCLWLHLVEVAQVVLGPQLSQTFVVVHNSIHLNVIRPLGGIPVQVPHTRTRHHLDSTTTSPNLHGQLHVVSTPFAHSRVEQPKLVKPGLVYGKDSSRGAWAHVGLWTLRALTLRICVNEVEVPFVAPMPGAHWSVRVPILCGNHIQVRHGQRLRILHHSIENMLEPMLVRNAMGFVKNYHIACSHLNTFGFGHHEANPLWKTIDFHLRRNLFELFLPRVCVAVRNPYILLDQAVWCHVNQSFHRSLHVLPLLTKPWNDDGNGGIAKV